MIVFTSDHGDYLGDHWMGEKDLFHDVSVKVPLIIYDPTPQRTRRAAPCPMPSSKPSIWRRHSSSISAARRRSISWKAARCCRSWRARRRARWRALRLLRIRLRHAGAARDARPAAARLPAVHGLRRPLQADARGWFPADAVRSRDRPARTRTTSAKTQAYADVRDRLQAALVHWSLTGHNAVTMPDGRILAYQEQGLQLKAGVIIGYLGRSRTCIRPCGCWWAAEAQLACYPGVSASARIPGTHVTASDDIESS